MFGRCIHGLDCPTVNQHNVMVSDDVGFSGCFNGFLFGTSHFAWLLLACVWYITSPTLH